MNTKLTLFSKAVIILLISTVVFALIGEVTLAGTIIAVVFKIILSLVVVGILYGFITTILKRL